MYTLLHSVNLYLIIPDEHATDDALVNFADAFDEWTERLEDMSVDLLDQLCLPYSCKVSTCNPSTGMVQILQE